MLKRRQYSQYATYCEQLNQAGISKEEMPMPTKTGLKQAQIMVGIEILKKKWNKKGGK
jgi:hypothetical protein